MKLFLTSTVFLNKEVTNKVFQNIDKPIKECKVLFIPNQKTTKEKLNSNKYLDRVIDWGFSPKNIHIFNKYNPDLSRNLDIDIITISGGNTFETLDIIRKTNFDKDIINYINKGVIFIGGSAGSHIVTKNIEHVLEFDSNDIAMTDFNTLGLFNGILICHYDEERKEIYNNLNSKYKIYTLTNDEILIVDNQEVKKI